MGIVGFVSIFDEFTRSPRKMRTRTATVDDCASCFSTLDLASGYWQVPLKEADRVNHYEFTVTFGLTNAPATFQRMMGRLLNGVEGCLVFLDDIIIFSNTRAEHNRILEEVLRRIHERFKTQEG